VALSQPHPKVVLLLCPCLSACLPFLALQVLRWCGFSDDFRNEMVFPLTALFFGTGNQVPLPSTTATAPMLPASQLLPHSAGLGWHGCRCH
jgi:hypothetical protein